jgi:predicted RNA-binding Zn ribbon-like protein
MPEGDNSFDWSGGHPALDFVNTLDERPSDEPVENLATYGSLVRFTEQAGLIEAAMAKRLHRLSGSRCTLIAKRARQLREQLHEVLAASHRRDAVPQNALQAVAVAIRQAHAARVLVTSTGSCIALHDWHSPRTADVPLHACAIAIEDLLINADRSRIRKCGAADCDVYFIDTSKGNRRHWCSMSNCGNREKQRRWRAGAG